MYVKETCETLFTRTNKNAGALPLEFSITGAVNAQVFPMLTCFLSEHHRDDVLAHCGQLVPILFLFHSAFFDSRFVLCLVLGVNSQSWA